MDQFNSSISSHQREPCSYITLLIIVSIIMHLNMKRKKEEINKCNPTDVEEKKNIILLKNFVGMFQSDSNIL